MTSRMADSPAAQAARDRRDANQGKPTGQDAPEPSGTYAAAQEQAKAKRQPRVDQSEQVKTMLASIRMQESGSYEGDYTAQGEWIPPQSDKSMGAYGIMSKNWAGYTSAAGIPNANWRDSRSQDRVAGQMVNNLANRFGGNMGLVAAAWFAGASVAQRVVDEHGYQATPQQIKGVLGPAIGNYAVDVVGHGAGISTTPYGVEHNLSDFNNDVGFNQPLRSGTYAQTQERGTAQGIVRERLVAMAGMGKTKVEPTDLRPSNVSPEDWERGKTREADEEAAKQQAEAERQASYRAPQNRTSRDSLKNEMQDYFNDLIEGGGGDYQTMDPDEARQTVRGDYRDAIEGFNLDGFVEDLEY